MPTAVNIHGKLNVLVNNAGIVGYAPIEQYSLASWDKIISINLTGVFNGIKAAVPAFKQAGGRSTANMSSLAGMRGKAGMPGYVTTKWGMRGLTRAAGFVHVLSRPGPLGGDPPYAVKEQRRTWLTGLRWGLGHTAGVLVVGYLH